MAAHGSVPVPDPTVLTTQQAVRESAAVRELMEVRVIGIKDNIETRLGAMDKAIELLRSQTDKFPAHVDAVILRLQELHEEKFHSIETQFKERDTRSEQTAKDAKVAIDAALQAQKEAVGEQNKSNALANSKMEAAFTKQIDQIGTLISTLQKSIDGMINDLKERMTVMESRMTATEGRMAGGLQQRQETRQETTDIRGFIFGAVGVGVAVIMMVVAVMTLMYRR